MINEANLRLKRAHDGLAAIMSCTTYFNRQHPQIALLFLNRYKSIYRITLRRQIAVTVLWFIFTGNQQRYLSEAGCRWLSDVSQKNGISWYSHDMELAFECVH